MKFKKKLNFKLPPDCSQNSTRCLRRKLSFTGTPAKAWMSKNFALRETMCLACVKNMQKLAMIVARMKMMNIHRAMTAVQHVPTAMKRDAFANVLELVKII